MPTWHVRVTRLDKLDFFGTPRLSPTSIAFNRAHARDRETNPIEARALPMAEHDHEKTVVTSENGSRRM